MVFFNNLGLKYDNLIDRWGLRFESPALSYLVVIIYKILLDLIYCKYIAGSHAFFSLEISIINVVNGWLAIFIMIPFINKYYRQKTCSAIIMLALNMIYFIPITTYCGYGGGSSSFLFFAIVYWAVLSILQVKIPIIGYKIEGININVSNKVLFVFVVLVSIVSLYIWWRYSGFRIQLNIFDVYEIRSEDEKNPLPLILSYAWHTITIVVPILIILMLYKRKYFTLVWLLFITVINFSYAGNKSVILFPIILIGGYIFYRKNMVSLIFPMGIIVEILAMIEQKLGFVFITSYLFRRQSLILAQLSEYYYRFFLENPTDLFRNSIMGKFGFDSVYSNTLANAIGNNFETQSVNCNNGLLADVWSGLGLIGIVVMPIIIIICFRLLDFVSYKVDLHLMIGLVLYYAIMFANTTWSTVLLTHGFLVLCLMLMIFPRENKEERIGVNI